MAWKPGRFKYTPASLIVIQGIILIRLNQMGDTTIVLICHSHRVVRFEPQVKGYVEHESSCTWRRTWLLRGRN